MSKVSSKLRIENAHEMYHMNSCGRVMGTEGLLGQSSLRGGNRVSIEHSSMFIYILVLCDICMHSSFR